jgi:hypothetical protein
MNTSQASWLTKPEGDEKISIGVFGYINARIRQRAYDLVIREFRKSGITQAQLCRRWGKTADYVSRFLSRPGNWEINTYTEALFAISGAIPVYNVAYAPEKRSNPKPEIRMQETTSSSGEIDLNKLEIERRPKYAMT